MNNEDDVLKQAKWLYAVNAGSSVEDMKNYIKQAIKTLHFEDELMAICRLFQITCDEYIDRRAKETIEILFSENSRVGVKTEKKLKGDIK